MQFRSITCGVLIELCALITFFWPFIVWTLVNISRSIISKSLIWTLYELRGRGPKSEQFCISVWSETPFQIFQTLFHRQITSCTALFNDIWHTLKKIIVCMHCSLKKWLTAIYIHPHTAKPNTHLKYTNMSNLHEGAEYSRIRLIPLKNITDTLCKLWHFQKMTNKVFVIRLDFSQNLYEISYLFGANCQSLIFNFFTSIRRVRNTYKATKMLSFG
jgi:hypothetical protein